MVAHKASQKYYTSFAIIRAIVKMQKYKRIHKDYKNMFKEGFIELWEVPLEYQSLGLVTEAIRNEGSNLEFVRPDLQTYSLVLTAVKDDPDNIRWVKPELQTAEMAKIAVKDNGINLEYIRIDLQSSELILMAVKDEPKAIVHADASFINSEIAEHCRRYAPEVFADHFEEV